MPKSRQQKEQTLTDLIEKFASSKAAVFINFDGLNVADTQAFRKACRENGLDYIVAKKTLLKLALDKNKLNEIDVNQFEKGVGTVFGSEDEVAPAQVVDRFAKDHEAMTILGGLMIENPEGQKFLDQASVNALAKLPSKEELLAKLVGSLKSPINGFANVLVGNLRGLVQVLNAIKDTKA